MSRQIACPNCGGEHELVNPGITMVVCSYCKTTVYWDDETVLKAGAQSILPEADTRLFLLASGALQGRGFTVVGHLRYDHGRGSWDEWYLQLDDGGVAWLSEDQRELTLESAARPDQAPSVDGCKVGAPLSVGGESYTVREVGKATCIGGEGQLPFTVLPGESYTYADAATLDGARFATLEFDNDSGQPTCFVGHTLTHDELRIDDEKPPSTAGSKAGSHIECANCAAPLEVPAGREVQTKVCEYCGAQLDLTAAQTQVLGINPKDFDSGLMFEIGQAATFYGKPYEVCGRMVYEDPSDGYRSLEYLLHNPEAGYLWLAEENGHYVVNRPTKQAPLRDPFRLPPKTPIRVGDTTFKVYETGSSVLVYVDGALPWLARSGDAFHYADLIAPPQMFGLEMDGSEIEHFHGRYLPPEEVWECFGRDDRPPRARGVHAAQPFKRSTPALLLMVMGIIFALVNLGFLGWSATKRGVQIFSDTYSADAYLKEEVSRTFQVGGGKVMGLEVFAPLSNSWIALDVGLINANDEVVMEVDNQISYYSGVEGGESWSEGKRREMTFFRAPPPGLYRLIFKGSGGTGNVGTTPRGEPLRIRVFQGAVLSRYFLVALIIVGLFPLFEIVRKRLFEQRRWAAVIEDDDDDD